MAVLYPDALSPALGAGHYREHEMLRLLADALPATWRVYHSVKTSQLHEGAQRYGELDAVAVAPGGHVAVLEIKAGDVDLSEDGAFKLYGAVRKSLVHQAHAQLQGLIGRLRDAQLGAVRIAHFLLLPDFRVAQGSVGYPRERIIDASQLDELGTLLAEATRHAPLAAEQVDRLFAFLSNRFDVVPDAACRYGQRLATTRRLSDGLATWVPRIHSPSGIYVVEATAGSGKTQLALKLLGEASAEKRRAGYVCFNRPLADHIVGLAPPLADVSTVHELAIAALRATGVEPDFTSSATYPAAFEALTATNAQANTLDLLIIDESQDFDGDWLQALLPRLKPDGRLYVMGDAEQAIYRKEAFDLPDATRIVCQDNFRSPRRLVDTVNLLGLTATPVQGRGPEIGDAPELHVVDALDPGGLNRAAEIIANLLGNGERLEDIAVLSFHGRERSRLINSEQLRTWPLRRFTGGFDAAGNARWTEGVLLADSVYRFKGQSAPIVIVCEIDFEQLGDLEARKLFVAMTRAQSQLHLIMSQSAGEALTGRLERAPAR
ncbi:AAA family ATPase [Variovorax ginsengisoli]|uniref:DNA 3'-5' helicase II n=1 Tax=Variovorax ginsengisoli TaxID=363844 RepID=A0ABT8SC06_9BURK|nr:ATP-binding domain-containing protein [Variovorax ginsengisoli]MDN8617285.1 AAA family ATPase [Variovorax ginsengisoli]MDO1536455.1 AAA family ATPase [Variovorax ginsengisoli]